MRAFKETIKMREGVKDEIYWVCDECGKDFDTENEADACCETPYDEYWEKEKR
jgi:hypothetical protein